VALITLNGMSTPLAAPVPVRDPAAAARRALERRERVTGGLLELDRWLGDQIRTGLAGFDRLPATHVERMAARLVDAQAPGVAGLVRALRSELDGEDWPDRLLDRLAALHLLSQAHKRLDDLAPDLAATVRTRIGYPVAKAQVLAGDPVIDDWLVLGTVDQLEGQLASRRQWVWGLATGTWGMLLSFAAPGQQLEAPLGFAEIQRAAVHRYPGSGQFRVLLSEAAASAGPSGTRLRLPVAGSFEDAQREFGRLLAGDPWATRMPTVVRGVPVPPEGTDGRGWALLDETGRRCPLRLPEQASWLLLALSLGRPIPIFGEWNGAALSPLSVLPSEAGTAPVEVARRVGRRSDE
jgi:hypothetical protein